MPAIGWSGSDELRSLSCLAGADPVAGEAFSYFLAFGSALAVGWVLIHN